MTADDKITEAIRLVREYIWHRRLAMIANGASAKEAMAALRRDLRFDLDG